MRQREDTLERGLAVDDHQAGDEVGLAARRVDRLEPAWDRAAAGIRAGDPLVLGAIDADVAGVRDRGTRRRHHAVLERVPATLLQQLERAVRGGTVDDHDLVGAAPLLG